MEIQEKQEQQAVRQLLESTRVYLFSVKLLRQDSRNPAKFDRTEEFYAAEDIKDVWAGIDRELNDESVEVESITRCVPILSFLPPTGRIV